MIDGSAHQRPASPVDVALRDGSSVQVRAVGAADRDGIRGFLKAMSADSAYFRGCGIINADKLADWAVDVDQRDRYGVLATAGPGERIVGHAAYIRVNPVRAEVAFEVADAMHGQGIGTLLLAQLAAAAVSNGISQFSADVMPSNRKMLEVFRSSGFPIRRETNDGLMKVVFDTALSPDTIDRFDARERHAARNALKLFLEPRSVAVIGASGHPDTLGGELIANLVEGGYSGALYPVNLHRATVRGLPALPSIAAVPHPVDLAVVVVPAAQVLDVVSQCGAAGTRAVVVVSAGFAETDAPGAGREYELLRICRLTGMRLIGPGALGLLNTDPAAALNASLIRTMPARGTVGLMSQSGGVGVALVAAASRLGFGLSTFVSVGNKADISGNDLLAYWDEDPATKVILLYLESFGNPRRFARFARHVAAHKPILVVKAGPTPVGNRGIEASSTARRLAGSEIGIAALFAQAGVIRADTTGELLETAALLSAQPAPAGPRVGVLSNSRGPALLCADACRAAGLALVELAPTLLADRLARRAGARLGANPINLTAAATAADYAEALRGLARSGECDALITVFVPSPAASAQEVADAVDAVARGFPSLCFASVLLDRVLPSPGSASPVRAARYMYPEEAARALGHAAGWSRWRSRQSGRVSVPVVSSPEAARSVIARALVAGPGWLNPAATAELLECYGLSSPADANADRDGAQSLLAGIVQDADFGPLVVCGWPGGEIAVRITPLSEQDAADMVGTLEGSTPNAGLARPLHHPAALRAVMLALGAMADAHPEIAALDLDPLWIGSGAARVGTARIYVTEPPATPAPGALR